MYGHDDGCTSNGNIRVPHISIIIIFDLGPLDVSFSLFTAIAKS